MAKQVYALDAELKEAVQHLVRQMANSFQPRPKRGRRPKRPLEHEAVEADDDIRGVSTGTITAATGDRDEPLTPGFGPVRLYTKPASGDAGTQWEPGEIVTAENWTRGTIPPYKPLPKLSISRKDDNGDTIYAINAEGCAEIPEEEE